MALDLVVGLGIVCFIFAWLAMKFNTSDELPLKVLMAGFFIIVLMLIPKAAIDTRSNCSTQIANYTTSAPTTSYEYKLVCFNKGSNTESIFWRVMMAFIYCIAATIVIFPIWKLAKESKKFPKMFGRFR